MSADEVLEAMEKNSYFERKLYHVKPFELDGVLVEPIHKSERVSIRRSNKQKGISILLNFASQSRINIQAKSVFQELINLI